MLWVVCQKWFRTRRIRRSKCLVFEGGDGSFDTLAAGGVGVRRGCIRALDVVVSSALAVGLLLVQVAVVLAGVEAFVALRLCLDWFVCLGERHGGVLDWHFRPVVGDYYTFQQGAFLHADPAKQAGFLLRLA